jgi:hypothetical protein
MLLGHEVADARSRSRDAGVCLRRELIRVECGVGHEGSGRGERGIGSKPGSASMRDSQPRTTG